MSSVLSIQVLGRVRGGQFSPCVPQPSSYFPSDPVAIGSKASGAPELVLPDSSVSPRHAVVVREGDGWVIQDLDSDNGVRSLPTAPGTDTRLETGAPSPRFRFRDELCCCVGAVVLRLKSLL